MLLRIQHRTAYYYSEKVPLGEHQLLLRPREGFGLNLRKCQITISPEHRIRWSRDLYENNVGLVDFTEPAEELVIACDYVVRTLEDNPFHFVIEDKALEFPFYYAQDLQMQLGPLVENIYRRDVRRVEAWLDPLWHPGKRILTLTLLQQINEMIFRDLRYQRREERGVQSPAETLEKGSGSCRDFAGLFMEACRCLGLAARFVSGYLYSPKIQGRMSMHAWAEVYLPGAGWVGFDPSWGIVVTSHYVPVAVTCHPEQAPPISGTYFGQARLFLRSTVDLYVEPYEEKTELPAFAQAQYQELSGKTAGGRCF